MSKDKSKSSNKKTTVTTSVSNSLSNKKLVSNIKSIGSFIKDMPVIGVIVAEFIGTFIITASFLEMQANPLFFGFALIGATLIVGGVSGAHLNPAITLGAFATRKIKAITAFFYITAQIIGGIAAWWVVSEFTKGVTSGSATANVYHAATIVEGKEWLLFYAELLGATILSLGIATAVRMRRDKIVSAFVAGTSTLIALYITLSITTALLAEQYTSLTFLNPAIAVAANAIQWSNWSIAIYIVAPVIGSLVGFAVQDYLHTQSEDRK